MPNDITVHLFAVPLDEVDPERLAWATGLLDDAERNRAGQFHRAEHRRRFVLRRAARRLLFGRLLGLAPSAVSFRSNPAGKPSVLPPSTPSPPSGIAFNASHSGDLALLAVTTGTPVGIDLENHHPMTPDLWDVRRTFAPEERRVLDGLAEAARARAFHACWTRKEAVIKCLGQGLQLDLDTFVVPATPARLDTPTRVQAPGTGEATCHLLDLDLGAATSGALATLGPIPVPQWIPWTWPNPINVLTK